MFNEYPYVNLQDVNLDWILKHIKELEINLKDFIKINTIKYADPIIWNITTQYEANTVVIDGNTGTAYLSVQPVPTGVALTNDDYWTPIFTLSLLSANQNITFRDDGTNVIATFSSDTGDWLLWNFYLYRVTRPISVNTAYLEGFNIERFTVELFIRDYISTLETMIGDLDDLSTSDKTSIVKAINSVLSDIDNELSDINDTIGDLQDLDTEDKTSIVNAINEVINNTYFVNPEMYGALGDGVHDDTGAIQTALNNGNVRLLENKTYLINDALIVPSNRIINGSGSTIKIADNSSLVCLEAVADKAVFVIKNKTNVIVNNVTFDLNGSSLGLYDDYTKLVNTGIIIDNSSDISVYNCRFINAYTEGIWVHNTTENINICYNYFKHILQNQGLRKTGVYCVSHTGNMHVSYNTFDELDIQPQYGCGGIFFANIFGCECSYNRIINCGRGNIYEHPVASICCYDSCENINIVGNYINSVESFIRLDASRGIRVSKNVCIYDKPNYYSDSNFIRFTNTSNDLLDYWGDIVIEDNIINIVHAIGGPTAPIGIINGRNDKPAKSFFIRNNKIWGRGAHAIIIAENISSTVISGNHIVGITSAGNISVSGGDNHMILNNIIDYGSILIRNTGSTSIDMYDITIANNRVAATSVDSLTIQNAALVNVHDNDLGGKSVYIDNATTNAIFVHDNHLHDSTDAYQFIGTNAHQHDNYYGNTLVTSFT